MKKSTSSNSLRPFSSIVFDGDGCAAARSMLYPIGFQPEDFKKPLIGVASTWGNVTPCNMHIDQLAAQQTLNTARQNLIQSQYSRLFSLINLYQALGGGWTEPTVQKQASDK